MTTSCVSPESRHVRHAPAGRRCAPGRETLVVCTAMICESAGALLSQSAHATARPSGIEVLHGLAEHGLPFLTVGQVGFSQAVQELGHLHGRDIRSPQEAGMRRLEVLERLTYTAAGQMESAVSWQMSPLNSPGTALEGEPAKAGAPPGPGAAPQPDRPPGVRLPPAPGPRRPDRRAPHWPEPGWRSARTPHGPLGFSAAASQHAVCCVPGHRCPDATASCWQTCRLGLRGGADETQVTA